MTVVVVADAVGSLLLRGGRGGAGVVVLSARVGSALDNDESQ